MRSLNQKKDSVIVATEQNEVVANEQAPKLPETVEEFEKALQSAFIKENERVLKKNTVQQSYLTLRTSYQNITELETKIKESGE